MSSSLLAAYGRLIQARRDSGAAEETLWVATERDRARIVQSSPVRRLQQKTQVFALDVKASVRSRLTHSLEVQQAGRQLLRAIVDRQAWMQPLATPLQDLLEMACLLHDVGNPPFGHFGEAVCRHWLVSHLDELARQALPTPPSTQWPALRADLLAFDGNAQSLRLVHSLQQLDLTYSQLAALIKYPYPAGEGSKAGYFYSEAPLMARLQQALGLSDGVRHPLVYLMELADDISYCIADLEDAVDRRLLSQARLLAHLRDGECEPYLITLLTAAEQAPEGFFPAFRRRLTEELVALASEGFVQQQSRLLAGEAVAGLLRDSPAARVLARLKQVAREQVFSQREVEALELQGHAAIGGVLDHYACLLAMPAADFAALALGGQSAHPLALRLYHRLPPRHLAAYCRALVETAPDFALPAEREWYYRVRLIMDFVSGMTDTYVLEEYRLLRGI
ncbi:dGTPase [Pseudaeromonas sp. ZJS20]|uniref:dGTPase n=1 Tax=Pseudaeromonas aegiceratis TaxID=3153928 RepID=UPI00390C7D02